MNKIAIAITTIRRQNNYEYLYNMLNDFKKVGIFNNKNFIVVVSESGTITKEEKKTFLKEFYVHTLFSDKKICANENVSKVIEYACSLNIDYIMYMNDDSTIHQSFPESVLKFIKKYPDYPCWSFYCPYYFLTIPLFEQGIDIYDYPYNLYYGSLCWVMRRKDALKYSEHLLNYYLSGIAEVGKEIDFRTKGGDLQLAKFLYENYPDKNIAAHVPSLVNHEGKWSSILNKYSEDEYYHVSKDFYLNR